MELATVFRERKDVLCCLQKAPRKTEKDALRPLYMGVKTSRYLVCQTMTKVRCWCKLLMKVNVSKGEHYHPNL